MGFYFSGHPLSKYEVELEAFANRTTETLEGVKDGELVSLGGLITNLKMNIDKKGKQMAFVTLEDFLGTVEVVIFSDCFEKNKKILKADAMVLIYGRASTKEQEKPKLIASEIYLLSKIYQETKPVLHLKVFPTSVDKDFIDQLKELLSFHPGESPVVLHCLYEFEEIKVRLKNNKIQLSRELLEKLTHLLGEENLYLSQNMK